MGTLLTFITYIVCAVFLGRFIWHVVSWFKAVKQPEVDSISKKVSSGMIAEMLLDIVFFRRLIKTNKILWAASWTFHISLFLVVLRHLRYFMYPVPDFVMSMQTIGIAAGYVLPVSLLIILIIRAAGNRDRYFSFYNFFLLTILLLTGVTGMLLKLFYRTGLVDIKVFMMGIVTFHPDAMPDSLLFIVHYVLVLILIPALPFHLIAAPVITVEASKRDRELGLVLHEK
jgi:nitrate reductase gamma subunit